MRRTYGTSRLIDQKDESNEGFVLINTEESVSYDGKVKNSDLPFFFFAKYKYILPVNQSISALKSEDIIY